MLVLGVDPGYAIVGYGLVESVSGKYKAVDFGAITTGANVAFEKRLQYIYENMDIIIKKYKPQALSIEQLFFQNNQKTAIKVAEARGVILLAAVMNNVPIYEYTPLQIKNGVAGYGRGIKSQIMEMTRRLLQLKEVPKPDDTADALAMAICHINSAPSVNRKIALEQRTSRLASLMEAQDNLKASVKSKPKAKDELANQNSVTSTLIKKQ